MTTPGRGLLLLAVLGAGACRHQASAPLDTGDAVPAIGVDAALPTLIWAFRAESCLNCELAAPATTVRVLAHQFENKLAVVAVAVGQAGDTSIVHGFLKRHRISAAVVTTSKKQHGRQFGQARLPALYLAHRGVIVDAVDLSDADAKTSRLRKATDRMRRWLESATRTDRARRSPPGNHHELLRNTIVLNGFGGTLERAQRIRSGHGEAVTLSNTQRGAVS